MAIPKFSAVLVLFVVLPLVLYSANAENNSCNRRLCLSSLNFFLAHMIALSVCLDKCWSANQLIFAFTIYEYCMSSQPCPRLADNLPRVGRRAMLVILRTIAGRIVTFPVSPGAGRPETGSCLSPHLPGGSLFRSVRPRRPLAVTSGNNTVTPGGDLRQQHDDPCR